MYSASRLFNGKDVALINNTELIELEEMMNYFTVNDGLGWAASDGNVAVFDVDKIVSGCHRGPGESVTFVYLVTHDSTLRRSFNDGAQGSSTGISRHYSEVSRLTCPW